MRKLLNFKLLRNVAIALILICSVAFGGRLDFGTWHQSEFIQGNCKIITKDFYNETVWIVTFSDGCIAGFTSDLSGANQRDLRWLERIEHGRIM